MTRPEPENDDGLGALLAAASGGDERAWCELVARYSRRVFALAKSRCRNIDVAEDITQSVFVTIAAKLGTGEYAERGRFESWLFRVAMNRVRDYVRRVKRRPAHADAAVLEQSPAAMPREGADTAAVAGLRAALEALSEPEREVIELRHHGGLSFKQIAELVEEPMGTLLARHHRAIKKLREILQPSVMQGKEVTA